MDANRRNFLKVMLLGSGVLMAEKFFGPLFPGFFVDSAARTGSEKKQLAVSASHNAFRIVEDGGTVSVYDDLGEEILQIDNKEA